MVPRVIAVLSLVLLTQGCAAGGTSGGDSGSTYAARTDVITQQELSEHPELTTVADAVRTLRPRWSDETIYIDDNPYVGMARDISTARVRELRYLDLSRAQMRWGQSISTPVIHVITR